MVKNSKLLEQWEKEFLSKDSSLTYEKALHIFTSLWQEATLLGALPSCDPMEGIETDINLAKILNSCLKKSSPK